MNYTIGVVAAVNNEDILARNLRRSPAIASGELPLLELRDQPSAAIAYNAGLDATDHDIIVYAHQDVYLPRPWLSMLRENLATLDAIDPSWAVAGLVGVSVSGGVVGRVWCSGNRREIGAPFENPAPVVSLDELVLIVRRSSGLRFWEGLPSFHLYGTDVCLMAKRSGRGAYAIHAPVVHNSRPTHTLRGPYRRAYRVMKNRWRDEIPIPTLCASITTLELGFWRAEWLCLRGRVRTTISQRPKLDSIAVARRLGYE